MCCDKVFAFACELQKAPSGLALSRGQSPRGSAERLPTLCQRRVDVRGLSQPRIVDIQVLPNRRVVEGGLHLTGSGLLAVIGSNPSTTSGVRTKNRAQRACSLLGFETFLISNLIDFPTYRSGDISEVAAEGEIWMRSRAALAAAVSEASGVLLAYGVEKPSGPARVHHREQLAWLNQEISARGLQTWAVGGKPRHPSRWQRFTYRSYPGVDFETALAKSLGRVEVPL